MCEINVVFIFFGKNQIEIFCSDEAGMCIVILPAKFEPKYLSPRKNMSETILFELRLGIFSTLLSQLLKH